MRRGALALLALLPAVPSFAQTPAPTPSPATPPPAGNTPQNPPAPVPSWLARTQGDLRALDKVSAGVTPFTLHIGQSVNYGSLTITLRACLVRPPNQPADSSAFLDITDSRNAAASFHGWMFSDEPEVSMLEHPVYDVRLSGCHD